MRHRRSATDFIRNRVLTLPNVVLLLANLMKSSLQTELDNYFMIISGDGVAARTVTKSAFCAARMKLKSSAFIELNDYLMKLIANGFTPKRWHGLDLRAIDGSTLRMPDTHDVIEAFGRVYPDDARPYPMAPQCRWAAAVHTIRNRRSDHWWRPSRLRGGTTNDSPQSMPHIVARTPF